VSVLLLLLLLLLLQVVRAVGGVCIFLMLALFAPPISTCLLLLLLLLQVVRAVGGVCIFLILALFTPPVSTCLLPPCSMPEVVIHVVPLLVSFAVSAFITVKDKFVHRLVFAVDWFVHPEDRQPWRWNILTSAVKLDREVVAGGQV
jgi:hypothetical protein